MISVRRKGTIRRLLPLAACAGLMLTALFPAQAAAAEDFVVRSSLVPSRPLRPGEFSWNLADAPAGELRIVVDLSAQMLHVYRGGHEVGRSTITSGRKGKETPTGRFLILEKDLDHVSSTYHQTPMPHMLRLTPDGISIHGSEVPGHRNSHGCVGVPYMFAAILYFETHIGDSVLITKGWVADGKRKRQRYDPVSIRMKAASAPPEPE